MYSEASRTWSTPQDLTAYDANVVALWIKGSPAGASLTETATGLKLKASGRDIWGGADRFGYAYKKLSGDGSITVKVDNLATFPGISGWAKAGIMIRETADAGSPQAMLCVTPANRAAFQYRIIRNKRSYSSHMGANSIALPHWLKLTRTGDVFEAQHSADGITWEAVGGKTKDTIPMSSDVLIGLSATPQNIKSTEADYSEITIDGAVTGDWTTEDIGNAYTFNTPDTLSITIEDASGNVYTAVHPDGTAAVINTSWQQWVLNAADITAAGVDLSTVTKISIGIGSKDAPVQGGTGKVYIDEISFGKPIPVPPVQE
jgi:regulation of enolase protein 1 (concanavalin A-like superfamily)